jgi:ABC-type multidrug transport system ATPase subunit
MISITGLTKSYGSREVLKDVDLRILPGEVVAIIGPSGAGKSTLLRCINMLEVPDSGRIHVDGRQVFYTPNARGKLGILPAGGSGHRQAREAGGGRNSGAGEAALRGA